MNEKALKYIRANRDVYTREAIDDKLREQGYSDTEIRAAWRTIRKEEALAKQVEQAPAEEEYTPPPRQQYGYSSPGCWLSLLVLTTLLLGVILLFLTNLGLSFRSGGLNTFLLWFVDLGSLAVLTALIVANNRLRSERGWSTGQIAGLIAAAALVWYLIVLGTCLSRVTAT